MMSPITRASAPAFYFLKQAHGRNYILLRDFCADVQIYHIIARGYFQGFIVRCPDEREFQTVYKEKIFFITSIYTWNMTNNAEGRNYKAVLRLIDSSDELIK
jgi:hypothetical protein